jgi:hypothetical protein
LHKVRGAGVVALPWPIYFPLHVRLVLLDFLEVWYHYNEYT